MVALNCIFWDTGGKAEFYSTIKSRAGNDNRSGKWGQSVLAFDGGNGWQGKWWQWTMMTAFDGGGDEQQ